METPKIMALFLDIFPSQVSTTCIMSFGQFRPIRVGGNLLVNYNHNMSFSYLCLLHIATSCHSTTDHPGNPTTGHPGNSTRLKPELKNSCKSARWNLSYYHNIKCITSRYCRTSQHAANIVYYINKWNKNECKC